MDFEQTYQNNLEFLKRNWSDVYIKIEQANINSYELIPNDKGEFNISINGNKIYPENINEALNKQLEVFFDNPSSYFKKPSWSLALGDDYVHDKFINDLEENSPYIKEKIPFNNYHHNLNDHIPLLVLYGIGSGLYIQELLKRAQGITDIIIVDESYELLKVSMHLMDWRPIFKYFNENHRGIHFVIAQDYKKVSNSLLNVIFKNYPYYFFHITYITHYNSNFFNNVKEEFLKKYNLGFTGLGFYDDEIISLNHTFDNLHNKRPIFRYTDKLPEHSVAFIIGSGPSVDEDIKQIKKLKDRAVIFSCGTSLKILYENGITPDYHIEMERPPKMLDMLLANLPKDYLKTINIIGLNVVYRGMFEQFKTSKIFFRENDAGNSIMPDDIPSLEHCNPTVVNATLSFASEIGFRNIFLFGADMGYKDPNNHHSKSSAYYKGTLKNHTPTSVNTNYPGNFNKNETFFSTDIFLWCKQRVENCILDYNKQRKKHINYFNCSDGLAILNCTPIHSDKVHISKDLDKNEVLQSIEESFDKDFPHIFQSIEKVLREQKDILKNDIRSIEKLIKAKEIISFEQFFILMKRVFQIASHIEKIDKSFLARSLLKGTTYHFMASVFTHALAGTHKNESLQYINESLNKYLDFLDVVKKEINNLKIKEV